MTARRDPVSGKAIVHRIEDGMDRQGVALTTYQMRNFYRQLGDGFFTVLDIMNYIQHHQVVRWAKPGTHLLDVCCGRGLLLPLLRYYRKDLGSYTGVDIAPENAIFRDRRVTDGQPIAPDYYPFPVAFVESNVAVMSQALPRTYDLIVYTSALEHMHHDMGLASLRECRAVSRSGTVLILTSPHTPEGADGYDTQYRAHIYEWKRSELLAGLREAGFQVLTEYGLLLDKRTLLAQGERLGFTPLIERLAPFVPPEWLLPVFAPMFPAQSKEIGVVAKAV